jgi:tetratricopeptide (TPR) repeat protein
MKKFPLRLWTWIALTCVAMWILLLSALTQRLNSQIDHSVTNELLVPVMARRHHIHANAAVARGEYKAAIEDFERAADLYLRAGEGGACIEYSLGVADCCMGRAHAHHALGELTKAIEYYSYAEAMISMLGAFGDSPVPPTRRAECLAGRGSAFAALHKYASAVHDFDGAIKIYLSQQQEPNKREQSGLMLADCMIRRGNSNRGQLDLREAFRDYRNAIAVCGRISGIDHEKTVFLLLARAYFNRSCARAMQGEFALAFLDLESARGCARRHTVIALDELKDRSLQLPSPLTRLVRRDSGQ